MKLNYDALSFWFREVGYTPTNPWSVNIHKALIEDRKDSEGHPLPTLVVVGGGEQSSKSYTGGHHLYATHLMGRIFWIVGERYEDCQKEFEYCTEAAIKAGVLDADKRSMPQDRSWRAAFNNGASIRTLSSSDVSSLSMESPDGILMVEAGRQSYQAFRTIWTRAQHHTGWILVSGTYESTRGRWFPDLWRELQGDNVYHGLSFALPSYANPIHYPGGEQDPKILAARKTLSEEEFAERFLGLPRPSIGIVFPEFRRSSHVSHLAEFSPLYPVTLWVDPGYYPSSYAVLFTQNIGGRIHIFDEIYVQHLVTDEVVTMVENHDHYRDITRVVIDLAAKAHAGAQTPSADAWRVRFGGRGVPIAAKFVKIEDGLRRTHDKLRLNPLDNRPYLLFHPRCEHSIWEFEEGYRYPVHKGGEIGPSLPLDQHNHAAKAIAYGLVDQFGYIDASKLATPAPVRRRMSYDIARR